MPEAPMRAVLAALSMVAALSSCAPEIAQPTASLSLTVAPLSYPGITDATFDIAVRNASSQVVFQKSLTSRGYGPGDGSLSYVGTCDASDGENPNTVSLTLTGLFTGAGGAVEIPASQYQNPGTLELDVDCVENTDVAVQFDLTILRQANQGFFDIAVSFSDIYCSAKLDCVDQDGAPLALLHDAAGARAQTVVLGLACTGDIAAGGETWLYRDPVVVTCADGTATVDPGAGPGNLSEGAGITSTGTAPLFGAAVYYGEELLGFNKRYWNVLLGLKPDATGCAVTTQATASPDALTLGATPAGTTWPIITWDVDVTDAGDAVVCTTHPVNGEAPHDGVATAYTGLTTPASFGVAYGPGLPPTPVVNQIVLAGTFRQWTDGTFADSCDAYLNPDGVEHTYAGDTGDGVYRLLAAGQTFDAWCHMDEALGEGWTLVMKSVADRWTYADALWTTVGTLNPGDWNLTAAGRAKYPAFDYVSFQVIRSTDPATFTSGLSYDFGAAQASALWRFQQPGFQIATGYISYWNTITPADGQQWGCTTYGTQGFNMLDYTGTAMLPGGSFCDWNGYARWGQRINMNNGGTGNHGGQGWGAESTIGNVYDLSQLMWVR
ncbi:MAG: hypothetical protein EP329_14280 [Deltaproteobacteria bacterium]|nr:MAG: hypothetical protein EP329_14280 [Deltaproteobacteria bacterium]